MLLKASLTAWLAPANSLSLPDSIPGGVKDMHMDVNHQGRAEEPEVDPSRGLDSSAINAKTCGFCQKQSQGSLNFSPGRRLQGRIVPTCDGVVVYDRPGHHEGQRSHHDQRHPPVVHKGDEEAKGQADDVLDHDCDHVPHSASDLCVWVSGGKGWVMGR